MTGSSSASAELALLKKTQALINVERSLTHTLEKVEPWLRPNTLTPLPGNSHRVRPIPSTMEEIHQVLAVARSYASRTSAPAGWNSAAPVVGFTTPNPLPHQLRGGALAALQLERARLVERDQKRKRTQAEEEEKAAKKKLQQEEVQAMDVDTDGAANKDSAKKTSNEKDPSRDLTVSKPRATSRPQQQQQQKVLTTTMNLSDSSSSSDDDSDSD